MQRRGLLFELHSVMSDRKGLVGINESSVEIASWSNKVMGTIDAL